MGFARSKALGSCMSVLRQEMYFASCLANQRSAGSFGGCAMKEPWWDVEVAPVECDNCLMRFPICLGTQLAAGGQRNIMSTPCCQDSALHAAAEGQDSGIPLEEDF